MSEKWVVVEMEYSSWDSDGRAPEEVYGIFDSEAQAEDWVNNCYSTRYYVKRIRKAVQDEWA